MLIDTHTHIYDYAFRDDMSQAITRAIDSGIEVMIFPNIDLESIGPMKTLHSMFPNNTWMAMGLHPTEIKETWEKDLDIVISELRSNLDNYIAIGEVGIDLYWDKSMVSQQMDAFGIQAEIASELDLPVIIHCRDGLNETLQVLSGLDRLPRTIFHSFGGTRDDVDRILALAPDSVFGINGIVTFKNSGLSDTIPHIGLDRIILETDSPYLAPVPHRGKRNESSYLTLIAAKVAEILNVDIKTVADVTSATAKSIFSI